jgi:hypothetical protein
MRKLFWAAPCGATLALSLGVCSTGLASTPAPGFRIDSLATPTSFGTSGAYEVTAENVGAHASDGNPVTLSDALPAGLSVQRISLFWSPHPQTDLGQSDCTKTPLQCTFSGILAPGETLRMLVGVAVAEPASSRPLSNSVSVSGGGAATVSGVGENAVGDIASFGPSSFDFYLAGVDGVPDTQAGAHPYGLTVRVDLNNVFRISPSGRFEDTSVQDVKDAAIDLPLGLLGSALATSTCAFAQLSGSGCPHDSALGQISTGPEGLDALKTSIYNMVPEPGVAAEFGYRDALGGSHVIYTNIVPTPAGYVLRMTVPDLPQVPLTNLLVSLFGDPAASDGGGGAQIALLTNPSYCSGGSLIATIHLDSWQSPGRYNPDGSPDLSDPNWKQATSQIPGMTGCNELQFNPSLSAQPDTTLADSPSGLALDLQVPQDENASTLATAPVKSSSVTLPGGMTFDLSAAHGLAACSEAQIGWLGGSPSNFTAAAPTCPQMAKIGNAQLSTPLFSGLLSGSVYLATPYANPFGSLLAAYVVIDDPYTGIVVKIPVQIPLDPLSGQISVMFDNQPQLPFSELRLQLEGGPTRGLLATPENCGTFTATSKLVPWSAPDYGAQASPSASFQIDQGCVSGFAPSFRAWSTDPQAGAYAPLMLTLGRSDVQQNLGGFTVQTPPGLLVTLAKVALCQEPQAAQGRCEPTSEVGQASVAAGVGPDPYRIDGGRVYLTAPYKGGAFGLSIVMPAVAGPFDLGNVVVRASVRVDPHTAQLTILSDPLPRMLDSVEGLRSGIPADIRAVELMIDRPGFVLNPTSCGSAMVSATIASSAGDRVRVSDPFHAVNCATLPFKLKLSALTRANGEFAGHGASLHLRLATSIGQANIRSLKLDLPQRLPARLESVQGACRQGMFESNPAACAPSSVIGSASVATRVLEAPMRGPVYLVARGHAFPDMVVVLQGQGIRIDLTGALYVDAKNVTSTTFRAMPDVPIRRFDLILPEGPRSILAAGGSLCAKSLHISAAVNGQNGARLKRGFRVRVSGCRARPGHGVGHGKSRKEYSQRSGG